MAAARPNKILEGLYLGPGFKNLDRNPFWASEGITHCVSIHHACPSNSVIPRENKLHIKISDIPTTNIAIYFENTVEFIHAARVQGGKVYVHCQMGISRSSTILAAYLMTSLGISVTDALCFVRKKRRSVQPNEGFLVQLKQFGNGESERIREKLHKYPDATLLKNDKEELQKILEQSSRENGLLMEEISKTIAIPPEAQSFVSSAIKIPFFKGGGLPHQSNQTFEKHSDSLSFMQGEGGVFKSNTHSQKGLDSSNSSSRILETQVSGLFNSSQFTFTKTQRFSVIEPNSTSHS